MNHYECGNCGYDMTGIEKFTNTVDLAPFGGFGEMMPMMFGGFYNHSISNSVTCPNCGRSGRWIKH